jgi:fructose-1,6-bisphosphatase/inositol monophosphatase family enzyme
VLDPIDGTSNFLHGIPHFAISIAFQESKPGGNGWGEVTQGLASTSRLPTRASGPRRAGAPGLMSGAFASLRAATSTIR